MRSTRWGVAFADWPRRGIATPSPPVRPELGERVSAPLRKTVSGMPSRASVARICFSKAAAAFSRVPCAAGRPASLVFCAAASERAASACGDLLVAVDDGCELCGAAVAQARSAPLRPPRGAFCCRAISVSSRAASTSPAARGRRRAVRMSAAAEPLSMSFSSSSTERSRPAYSPAAGKWLADMRVRSFSEFFSSASTPVSSASRALRSGGQRLADAVGVLQHRQLLLHARPAPRRAGWPSREFLALEPEPLLVAAAVGGRFAQGREPAPQLRKPRILRGVLRRAVPRSRPRCRAPRCGTLPRRGSGSDVASGCRSGGCRIRAAGPVAPGGR